MGVDSVWCCSYYLDNMVYQSYIDVKAFSVYKRHNGSHICLLFIYISNICISQCDYIISLPTARTDQTKLQHGHVLQLMGYLLFAIITTKFLVIYEVVKIINLLILLNSEKVITCFCDAVASQTLSRWYCTVDENLSILHNSYFHQF